MLSLPMVTFVCYERSVTSVSFSFSCYRWVVLKAICSVRAPQHGMLHYTSCIYAFIIWISVCLLELVLLPLMHSWFIN